MASLELMEGQEKEDSLGHLELLAHQVKEENVEKQDKLGNLDREEKLELQALQVYFQNAQQMKKMKIL